MRTAIGFLLFLLAAAAQSIPPSKASIEGHLENVLTGEPLRQGVLRLSAATSAFRGPEYIAQSDSTGRFEFEQVEPGSYVLSADRIGFLHGNYGARFLIDGEAIRLRAGDRRSLRVALAPKSSIAGRVVEGDGEPIRNIEVAAWRWRWSASAGQRLLQLVARTTPDGQGNFRFNTLPAGQFFLSASSLSPYRPNGPGVLRRRTSDKAPEGYQPTFYPGVLSVGDAKGIDLGPGQDLDGLSLPLKRSKRLKIRGTVADHYSFRPLNLMMVELTPLDRPAEAFPGAVRSVAVEDGAFEFDSVPPGRYSITARDYSPAEHLVARTDVTVADKEIENVRLDLRAGAEVKCVIRVERPHNEVHDLPQGAWQSSPMGAMVMLRSPDGGLSRAIAATQDLPGGPFRLRDIPPGSYWVDVTNLPVAFYVKSIRFGEQDVTTVPLKVSQPGVEPQLEVILSDRTATLSGIVVGASGGPVQVMLAPASRELERVGRLVKGTVSGVGGTFRFEGVAPGQYVVLAFEDAEPGLAEDPEFRAGFLGSGTEVELGPSGNRMIEVRVAQ
jgi:protocatechuate 3,4-dioxygenase beta subunit